MKKKLLLADDSVTIQKVVQITFSHDDYELIVVDNGDAAYEKARAQRPDLILADVFMPGKNGYDLCAAVKHDPELAMVPVLLLTGTFEPFDETKARAVGADRWIAKPFESQTLIACVEELLRNAAQAPAAAPAPPAVAPPLPEIAPPVEEAPVAGLPDDIWGDEFVTEPAFAAAGGLPLPTAVSAPQDELWDVAGFETEEHPAETVAADDLWGSFDGGEIAAEPEDFALPVAPSAAENDLWGSGDFAASFEAAVPEPAESLVFADEEQDLPPLGEVEVLEEIDLLEAEEELPVVTAEPFAESDFAFGRQPAAAPAAAAGFSVGAVSAEPVAPPLAAVPSPVTASRVESQAEALSEAQLEQIVEKVAGVVIDRLAGTILEKIAWEVVPDLAETMIKEELRKLREAVAAS